MRDNDKKVFSYGPILAGALLIHPACFALAFATGFIFGCPKVDFGATNSAVVYRLEGGGSAIMALLLIYIVTLGITPLVVSGVGAIIGLGVAAELRHHWLNSLVARLSNPDTLKYVQSVFLVLLICACLFGLFLLYISDWKMW